EWGNFMGGFSSLVVTREGATGYDSALRRHLRDERDVRAVRRDAGGKRSWSRLALCSARADVDVDRAQVLVAHRLEAGPRHGRAALAGAGHVDEFRLGHVLEGEAEVGGVADAPGAGETDRIAG